MYSTDSHHRFIELRAQGWSLARIADELQIARRTLVQWQHQHAAEIAGLHAVELEALQERVLASHENELGALASQLARVQSVLTQRKFECLSTEFLFCMAGALRSQIRKQRLNPVFTPPPATAPEPSTPLTHNS